MLMQNDLSDTENADFIREQILYTVRSDRNFNSSFYHNIEDYNRLQKILNKNDYQIKYINAEFSDFPKALGGNYDSINLSNIYDYVDYKTFIETVKELYDNNLINGGRILLHYDFGAEIYDDDCFPREICNSPVLSEFLWIDKSQHKRDAIFVLDKPKTLLNIKNQNLEKEIY